MNRDSRRPALIDAESLSRRLASASPAVLLDVRWQLGGSDGREEYLTGHLPGARYINLDRDLSAPPGAAGRHPLPEVGTLQATLRHLGIGASSSVVAYDAAGGTSAAARAWWMLRYVGHDDVAVLDGGIGAWLAAGGELTDEVPQVEPGEIVVAPGAMTVLSADDAADVARRATLLDARAPERYRGDVEPVDPVGGHIPGAVSAPTSANLGPDGRFLEAQDLRRRFQALGVERAANIGVYCGSGVTAAHEVLALELAGYRAGLYPGSWSAWVADGRRPVATGDAP